MSNRARYHLPKATSRAQSTCAQLWVRLGRPIARVIRHMCFCHSESAKCLWHAGKHSGMRVHRSQLRAAACRTCKGSSCARFHRKKASSGARTYVALLIHVDGSNLRDVKKEPRNSRRVEKMTERELRIIISILMEILIHVDVNLRVALGLNTSSG